MQQCEVKYGVERQKELAKEIFSVRVRKPSPLALRMTTVGLIYCFVPSLIRRLSTRWLPLWMDPQISDRVRPPTDARSPNRIRGKGSHQRISVRFYLVCICRRRFLASCIGKFTPTCGSDK
jgi:hypothetical protein